MLTVYGKLAEVYYTRRDLDQAEDMFKKQLEMEEELDNKEAIAKIYGFLGDIYRLRLDFNQAEELYKKSLQLFAATGAGQMVEVMQEMLANLKKRKVS
jgi:tetratricopeptide (TPR) repeat protein